MFVAIIQVLREKGLIEKDNDGSYGDVAARDLIKTINSHEFLTLCPKVRLILLFFIIYQRE